MKSTKPKYVPQYLINRPMLEALFNGTTMPTAAFAKQMAGWLIEATSAREALQHQLDKANNKLRAMRVKVVIPKIKKKAASKSVSKKATVKKKKPSRSARRVR
jgi:hypothetical protein